MFAELINAIQDGVKPEILIIDDEQFSSRPLVRIPNEQKASVLSTFTLDSICDYLSKEIDNPDAKRLFIHVESHDKVSLNHYLNSDREREVLVRAEYSGHSFAFNQRQSQQTFITGLQSQFVDSEARKELQQFVGSLTSESSVKLEDDGIAQRTVAKRGITTVDRVSNENVHLLRPFRTFAEIEQPESSFILRLYREEDSTPTLSLHESDNSKWKLTAIASIKAYFEEKGVTVPVIA